MLKIVPSDAAKMITDVFHYCTDGNAIVFRPQDVSGLKTVLRIIEHIPADLVVIDCDTTRSFMVAVSEIEYAIETLIQVDPAYSDMAAVSYKENPVFEITSALEKCPDEKLPETNDKFLFIEDNELRDSICQDVAIVETALQTGQWKVATVFSGVVIEALLLWVIKIMPHGDIQKAASSLKDKPNKAGPDYWVLSQYIQIASELKLIDKDTETLSMLSNGFRNLIHPRAWPRRL